MAREVSVSVGVIVEMCTYSLFCVTKQPPCDESRFGHVNDLLGLEVAEVDHRDAAVRAIVDVEEAPVVLAVGLARAG